MKIIKIKQYFLKRTINIIFILVSEHIRINCIIIQNTNIHIKYFLLSLPQLNNKSIIDSHGINSPHNCGYIG